MTKLNLYFFGEENVSVPDALWFYGTYIATVALMIFMTATID